jgi:anti-sigma factor (TIGR02949 family)
VDCQDFRQWITAAVDDRLSDEDMRLFRQHAVACTPCRTEFEIEAVTKSVVRSHVEMVRTPPDLIARISDSLDDERHHPRGTGTRWREVLRDSVYFKPLLAFAVGALAIILLLREPDESSALRQASLLPVNILEESLQNYQAVVNGTIRPQVEGSSGTPIEEFFRGKTTFSVHVPRMRECEFVGGVLNDYAGVALAHVVYRHRGEVVYLYEACWEEVQKGSILSLPDDVREELRRTGWHTIARSDGYSMVLWTREGTLCTAVAHLPAADLRARLEDAGGPAHRPW